ncbi:hypothetical protein Ais01nite_30350 [Asanoa ishikariensis]|nr:hypothetical protein Ais01nite_30350 [Asanoa ishikariensis]
MAINQASTKSTWTPASMSANGTRAPGLDDWAPKISPMPTNPEKTAIATDSAGRTGVISISSRSSSSGAPASAEVAGEVEGNTVRSCQTRSKHAHVAGRIGRIGWMNGRTPGGYSRLIG